MKRKAAYYHNMQTLTFVDRTTGRAKAIVVDDLKVATWMPILRENIAKEATLYTDEAKQYARIGQAFVHHDFTTHKAK